MNSDSNVIRNIDVNTYSTTLYPTQPTFLPSSVPTTGPRYAHAAHSLLQTVTLDMDTVKNWAILDSGATSHFLVTDAPTTQRAVATNPLRVKLPNGDNIQSTHTCTIDINALPAAAREGHIIPGLASHSLLSVVKLCNAGCEVTFTKIGCIVKHNGRIVLQGYKCRRTGLWMVPIQPHASGDPTSAPATIPTQMPPMQAFLAHEYMANVIPTSSMEELAMYHHQILGSPPPSTLLKAIRNYQLESFPGLTYELISKNLPPATATDKGHMVRTRQGARSTRNNRQQVLDARLQVDDMNPPQQACNAEDDTMSCYAVLADSIDGTMYSDLTGRFPVQSFSGNQYIFVAYIYKINAILLRPMKNRSDESMVAVFKDIYEYLQLRNLAPKLHVLDNECSKAIKKYIISQNTNIQLVEPHNHRVNAAETAVKTAKYHFISGLATIDVNAPLQLWDQWLAQSQDTLNMMRTSRQNSSISAYEEMEGKFDFNRTPMAPFGTKGLAYLDPDERLTFQTHGVDVYYVARSPFHYRLMKFYDPISRNFRTTGTYKLYPTHCKVPTLSTNDRTIMAAHDIAHELQSKLKDSTTKTVRHARIIQQLNDIMSNTTPSPRVGSTNEQPSNPSSAPRVRGQASTSNNTTAPDVIRQAPRIHQRQTRNNTPMPTIMETIEPTVEPPNHPTSRPISEPHTPTAPDSSRDYKKHISNGEYIGSKRNHVKHASRKRIQSLINTQIE